MTRRQEKIEKFVVYFTFIYVGLFSINSLAQGNSEFIYYTAVMLLSILMIMLVHRRIKFYPIVFTSLSLLGLLHLLGGNYAIGETRLYDWYIFGGMFRYDNLVHMFGSAIMVMLAYALLHPTLADDFKGRGIYFGILLVLIGMGLGAINELVEFFAVLLFDVSDQVGDYTNTLLDLLFNTFGSIVMAIILLRSKIPLVEVHQAESSDL